MTVEPLEWVLEKFKKTFTRRRCRMATYIGLSRFSPEASGDPEEFEKLADEQEEDEEEEEEEDEEEEKDKEAEDEEDEEEDWQ